jgi:carboxyl-terminal processing protease
VGERTFGKGSVQLIHELSDESSLHVTNGEWFTPAGVRISGNGLVPEVVLAPGQDPLSVAIDTVRQITMTVPTPDAG